MGLARPSREGFTQLMKKDLINLTKLQPMSYFKKFERILISNLLVSLHKANREFKRTDGDYYMTGQVINEVETKPILFNLFFVGTIIDLKYKLWRKK